MKKLTFFLLGLYTVLIPIFYWYGVDFRTAQMKLWQCFCVVFACTSLFAPNKEIKPDRFNMVVGSFGLWALILYAITGFTLGAEVYINIFYAIVLYGSLIRMYGKDDYTIVRNALLGVGAYTLALILMQVFWFDPIYLTGDGGAGQNDPIGPFCLKAAMGMFFAITWGFWLERLETWQPRIDKGFSVVSKCVLGCIPLYPLCVSRSSGAIVAAIVSVLFYMWFRVRKAFWATFAVLFLAGSVFILKYDAPMGMFETRPPVWKLAIKMAMQQPLTGFCLDATRTGPVRFFMDKETKASVAFPRVSIENGRIGYSIPTDIDKYDGWDNLHNEGVTLLYEMGIIGVGIFLWGLYESFKRLRKTAMTPRLTATVCGIIAILLCGMTQFPFHLARIGFVFPLLLAMMYTETNG